MDRECSDFTVNYELCKKVGSIAKWANNSLLTLTSISSTSENSTQNEQNINILHLKPEFIFDDPILHSLLAESNSIFLTLQKLGKTGKSIDYIKLSRAYRSVIRACLDKLQDVVTELVSTSSTKLLDKNKCEDYITIFYSIECIWHLCEILIIDPAPSNIVITQLLEWIRFHFPSAESHATDLLLHGREANLKTEYWPTIKGLILQGQIDVARALLQLHSSSETNEFKLADQILNSMPLYNISGGISVQKFRSQWQYWLDDTEIKLSSGILSSEPELEDIIKITTGGRNTAVWNELILKSEYWYEYFPGFLLYTEPTCKHYELVKLADCWLSRWANIKEFGNSSFLKLLDRILLSLMENDMNQVLHLIQKINDNQWFVTHLVDLLHHCGKLSIAGDGKKNKAIDMRNALLFEFGLTLMSRKSFWLHGIDYLEYCSTDNNQEGLHAIETMLSHMPIDCDKDAFKIINVARRKNMISIEQDICKAQAKKSMSIGRYGNALEWAIRSNDACCVTMIANHFLNHYSSTGKMLCPDILSNIGAKMFIAPRLVFLVKYFDFHSYYEKREFTPAAELLVNLLDSKITPEHFWPALLIDTIPLLESKDPKIPSKNTFTILHYVETALVPLIEKKKKQTSENENSINLLKDYRIEDIEKALKLLRLACARNLSRALILENTIIS